MTKRKFTKIGLLIIFPLIVILATLRVMQKLEDRDYHQRGALLINKIEMFRQTEGRLPDNVHELGLEEPMGEGPCYRKEDAENYIVFFSIGFDHEVRIYNSDKKEWSEKRELKKGAG